MSKALVLIAVLALSHSFVLPSIAKLQVPVTQADAIAFNQGLINGLTNSTTSACYKALDDANNQMNDVLTYLNELSEGQDVSAQLATAAQALFTSLSNSGSTSVCNYEAFTLALQNLSQSSLVSNYLFHGSAINADINNLNDPNGTYQQAGYDLGNAFHLLTGITLGGSSSYQIPVTPEDYANFLEGVAEGLSASATLDTCATDLVNLTPTLQSLLTSVKNLAKGQGNIFSLISQITAFQTKLTAVQTACATQLSACTAALPNLTSADLIANYKSNASTINADLVELKNPTGTWLNGGKAAGEIFRLLTGCSD